MTRSQLILTIAGSLVVIFLVLVFTGVIPGLKPDPKLLPPPPPPIQINLWGLRDDADGFRPVISGYKSLHPEISINYIPVDESNYENRLIDNLAAGTGPDIFMLQNSWVPKFRNKISAAPATVVDGAKVFDLMPPVVSADFVSGAKVWGLPVSIDTLALVYNRSILDAKQIPLPPVTWDEVKAMAPKIKESNSGIITKSAIALGGGETNVRNATDILSAMLLQLKNKIIDFQRAVIADTPNGSEALNFYTSFSDPTSSAYTWDNKGIENSINSFANGRTAMVVAYKRDINEIKIKNPGLNMLIAPMPQFDINNPISLANYWGLTVASQSKNQALAWDFINYAAFNTDAVKNYISFSGMPPALRELIPAYQSDPLIKVFASQILTAQSVPFVQYPTVSAVLNEMIESTLLDRSNAQANLRAAANKISALIIQ